MRRQLAQQGYKLQKSRTDGVVCLNGVYQGLNMDNYGGYRIIDASTNMVVAGERFDLSMEDVERLIAEDTTTICHIKQKYFLKWMREWYDIINKEAFHGELPYIPMRITNTKDYKANAWFCVERQIYSYININGEHKKYQIEYPSIAIGLHNTYFEDSCELLYGIDLLAHEMIHFYCYIHGLHENDHKTQYHNYLFLETAEKHGLCSLGWDKEYGFSNVKITDELFDRIIKRWGADYQT